jgi:hypothetical protein
VKWAKVGVPETTPVPVLLESGELTTGPNEVAILLPIKPREALEQVELQTWREKGKNRETTKLNQCLILIFPNVCYRIDVPFVALFCPLSPLDSAAKGS